VGPIFKWIRERRLLKRLKHLCKLCGFDNPRQCKLHSFRHHFAGLCANHNIAYHRPRPGWTTALRRGWICTTTCTTKTATGR